MAATTGQAKHEPSEVEIFDGSLKLTLGGVVKPLRPLPVTKNRAWKIALAERAAGSFEGLEQRDWAGILGLVSGLVDVQIDLLLEYDVEGRLGGREWLEEHATEGEIYEAFKVVLEEAFPPLRDARRFPQLVAGLLPQLLASSGNSPSAPGDAPAES